MRGDCFLGEPEGKAQKRHLKIILTEPDSNSMVVIATVTTLKHPEGQAVECILREGDHPFIKHDSFVDFRRTTARLSSSISDGLDNRELIRKEALTPEVFERVLKAAKSSRKMPPRIKAMLLYS